MEIPSFIKSTNFKIAVLLILIGVVFRLFPHEANFAPVAAISLVAGAALGRKFAIIVPLSIMVITDSIIGFYSSIAFTWSAFIAIALFGTLFKDSSFVKKALAGSLGASFIFFLVSNLGVWISSGMYTHTLQGLIQCFYMALPFFRATLLSDLFYSVVIFGILTYAVLPLPILKTKLSNQYSH